MLTDSLVVAGTLASVVPAGGDLLVQTDVEELMDAMRPVVAEAGSSADEAADEGGGGGGGGGWWASAGATTALEHCGVASSREAYVRSELDAPIFGELFTRTDLPCRPAPQDQRLYCGASHLWLQGSETEEEDEAGRSLVKVGLTERGLDEIGNVLRCATPASVDVAAGVELLRVDWDAYTVTEADELYQ